MQADARILAAVERNNEWATGRRVTPMARFRRWWRYRRYLNAEVSRRQYLGYNVGPAVYEDLRGQARARAGYEA